MSKSLKRVQKALDEAGFAGVEILHLETPTRTAAEAAAAVGCQTDQIAKSIIFKGADSGQAILFLTAGGRNVDPALAAALAGETLEKADAALIRAQTGFAIGGVSPVGHLNPIRAFVDRTLLTFEQVWAAAGTPHHVFALSPADMVALSGGQVADFVGA